MAMGRFWIMHLYSCLSYSDLELIYSKCRQWGLKLQSSNAWGDCFEKTEGAEIQYKVVPANVAANRLNLEHWKLVAKNDKYVIFEYDKQCGETERCDEPFKAAEELRSDVNYNIYYFNEVMFLLAFPILAYNLIQKFNAMGQSVLPGWMNKLFLMAICTIYAGHFFALLTSFFQTRHYVDHKDRIKRSYGGFYLRLAISCIVNILQFLLILVVSWGMMKK